MANRHILLAHGGGGLLAEELMSCTIAPALGLEWHGPEDSGPVAGISELRLTTDAYVVKPLFFPGGNIGSLAIHGTVNDLAVSGAAPLSVCLALILEEGLELDVLVRVLEAAGAAARQCGVRIATGDTKVVPRRDADQLFVVTSGLGRTVVPCSPPALQAGDAIVLSGPIGEHGIAVLSAREGLAFGTTVQSDSRSVWPLVQAVLGADIPVHGMRDPTRGGVAAVCNELADGCRVSLVLDEERIPVTNAVMGACEMLGLDPLTVANEGKFLLAVPSADADRALECLRAHADGGRAAVIGTVTPRRDRGVYLRTRYGGERIVESPYGEELPRIC